MANLEVNNIISQKLTGSLTQLGDGTTPYLSSVEDDFIITSGSNGQVELVLSDTIEQISIESHSTNGQIINETGTFVTVEAPSGIEKDDYLLAIITFRVTSTTPPVITTSPDGWTEIAKLPPQGSGANNVSSYICGKFANENEPIEYSWGFSTAVRPNTRIIRIKNVNRQQPIAYTQLQDAVSNVSTTKISSYLSSNFDSLLVTFVTRTESADTESIVSNITGNVLTTIFNTNGSNVGHNQEARWKIIRSEDIGQDISFSTSAVLSSGVIVLNPKNKFDNRPKEYFYRFGSLNPYNLQIPAWANIAEIEAVGGGGGGGSGRRSDIAETRRGGAGGNGGTKTIVRKNVNEIFKLRPNITNDRCQYKQGQISSSGANIVTTTGSPCPGVLQVKIPENAKIIGVDTQYDITAQNSAFMNEQRSFIRVVGGSDDSVQSGTGSSEGTFSYDRKYLPIANSITGGEITFELHVGRTWPNANDSTCNTTYQFVPNNTWNVTVHYIDPDTSAPMQITVGAGGTGGAARTSNLDGLPGGDGGESFVSVGNLKLAENGPTVLGEQVFGNPTENLLANSVTINTPTNTQKGDLLLAIIGGRSGTTNRGIQAIQDGWTVIADVPAPAVGHSAIYVAYRTDAAAGESYGFRSYVGATSPSGDLRWVGRLIRITDYDPENPIASIFTDHIASTTTIVSSVSQQTPDRACLRITSLYWANQSNPTGVTSNLGSERLLDAINTNTPTLSVATIQHVRQTKHIGSLYEEFVWSTSAFLGIADIVINPSAIKIATAPGGIGGPGGTTALQTPIGVPWQFGSSAPGGNTGIGVGGVGGSGLSISGPGGGGGGGALSAANAQNSGGGGGTGEDLIIENVSLAGAGGTAGVNGENANQTIKQPIAGSGAGGGGSRNGAAAGSGGNGARGSGGGGGGGSNTTSGAGGQGGDGYVVIRFYQG